MQASGRLLCEGQFASFHDYESLLTEKPDYHIILYLSINYSHFVFVHFDKSLASEAMATAAD